MIEQGNRGVGERVDKLAKSREERVWRGEGVSQERHAGGGDERECVFGSGMG